MERLNRIDKHRRYLASSSPKNFERRRMKVLERQAIADSSLATEPRLYAIPPAMVSAGETHDQFPSRVESSQPDRGHDGFGTAHVKGYLVESGNGFQKRDVFGDHRMQRSQYGTKVIYFLQTFFHPGLVAIEAGHVESV